jgi:hypothetical protein
MAASLPNYGFNLNPAPTSYSPIFGGVPGALSLPTSTYQQSVGAVPQLSQLTSGAAGAIGSDLNQLPGLTNKTAGVIGGNLAGQLSPDVINAIKNMAASWGVAGGMPGSDISANKALSTIGLTSEQLQQLGVSQFNQFQQTGLSGYNQFLTGLGGQQLQPGLESQIQSSNAMMAAAPDPTQANEYLQSLLTPQAPQGTSLSVTGPTNQFKF